VFDLSALRELPARLATALDDVDSFNQRAVQRYRGISRDDMLTSLQAINGRVITSAKSYGGDEWAQRRLIDLARPRQAPDGSVSEPRAPSVGGILRSLLSHEAGHAQELRDVFHVTDPEPDSHMADEP